MEKRIILLLEENNSMLKEILAILKSINSEEYQSQNDMHQFFINVAADIFVEALKNNKSLMQSLKDNFKI